MVQKLYLRGIGLPTLIFFYKHCHGERMNSDYLNFDLLLIKFGEYYKVTLVNSPAGQGQHKFKLSFSIQEMEGYISSLVLSNRRSLDIETTIYDSVEDFGGELYSLIFGGEIGDRFLVSQAVAEKEQKRLRIRLNFSEAPCLINVPWELLYCTSSRSFISLSNKTPVIRKMDLTALAPVEKAIDTIKVLVVISDPQDHERLDVEKEWHSINLATSKLQQKKSISLERVKPSLTALQRRLQSDDYHVFHFIGHGGFDSRVDSGVLVFEDEHKKSDIISASDLGTILHDENSVQLALLNSCSGGKTSAENTFSGAGQSLLQSGVQSVVSMQFDITDKAAIIFAEEFYSALVNSYPPDSAVSEARKIMYTETNSIDWAAPVFYSSLEIGSPHWKLTRGLRSKVELIKGKLGCFSISLLAVSMFLIVWIFYFSMLF